MLPSDKLCALFVLAGEELGIMEFRAHGYQLQESIHYLQQQDPDNSFFKDFIYSNDGLLPFSPILEESMSGLVLSGLVCRPYTDDWQIVRINPSAKEYYELDVRTNVGEREELDRASLALSERLVA